MTATRYRLHTNALAPTLIAAAVTFAGCTSGPDELAAPGGEGAGPPGLLSPLVDIPSRDLVSNRRGDVRWMSDIVVAMGLFQFRVSDTHPMYPGEIVEWFDPDFIDWFNRDDDFYGLGVLSSYMGYQYQEVRTDYPHFHELESDGQGLARDIHGEIVPYSVYEDAYFACHLSPWHERHKQATIDRFTKTNLSGLNQDNVGLPWKYDVCFCHACLSGYRQHLQDYLTTEQLIASGVQDLDDDELRTHLEQHRGKLSDDLIRGYVHYQFRALLIRFDDLRDSLRSLDLNRSLSITGNQWGVGQRNVYASLLSPGNDLVGVESDPKSRVYQPPRAAESTLTHKIGYASGGYQKPVWIRGGIWDSHNTRAYRPDLWSVVLAEAFANGTNRIFSISGEGNGIADDPFVFDQKVHDNFFEFAEFLHENRATFQVRESLARVGLVYSVPTLSWRHFPPLGLDGFTQWNRLAGFARALDDGNVPFDVLFFGAPELFDDTDFLQRLTRYHTLILPGVDSITDEQQAALEDYVKQGGALVVSGPYGKFDETLATKERSVPSQNVVQLSNDEELSYFECVHEKQQASCANTEGFKALMNALVGARGERSPLLQTDAPVEVVFNLWNYRAGQALGVHLVNYTLDTEGNNIPLQNVTVTIDPPLDFAFGQAVMLAPGQDRAAVPVSRDGSKVTFTVEQLRSYAIVLLGDPQEMKAADRISMARKNARKLQVLGLDTAAALQTLDAADQAYGSRDYQTAIALAESITVDVDTSRPGPVKVVAPADGAVGVTQTPILQWEPDLSAPTPDSYDLYIGLSATLEKSDFQANVTQTSFDVGAHTHLEPNTTYYWSVAAVKPGGRTLTSVWSFTTGDQ